MLNYVQLNIIGAILLVLTGCGLMACLSSTSCFAQEDEYLGVNNVEDRVKREFRLTPQDLRYLHPVIKSENEKILVTYRHFSEQDSENFVPSFLTARELQAWDPAKSEERRVAGDRRIRRDVAVRRIVHDEE